MPKDKAKLSNIYISFEQQFFKININLLLKIIKKVCALKNL